MICAYCREVIAHGSELAEGGLMYDGKRMLAHRECALRAVLGGIGHLENHAYWCLFKDDPDAGLSYRESALRVDEWVAGRAAKTYEEED